MLGAALPSAATGTGVGIEVADAGTGQVLYSANASALATPASTTKVVTAVASLAALGPERAVHHDRPPGGRHRGAGRRR